MEVKPGYKQTEVGAIPEEWDVGCAKNLIHKMKSGLSRRLQTQDIGIPVLTSANIQNNQLIADELKYWYLKDPQGANVEDYVLNDGDILVCFINSMAQIGKPCVFRDIGRPAIYTTNIFRIIATSGCVSEFAFYLFSSSTFQEAIQLIAKPAVNQASFTKPDFYKIALAIPPLPEQRAIATALSDVDGLLGGLDRLIAKKRDLKQAAMQQLLTGQTRLPGFHGEWEVKRLGDVCRITTGKKDVNEGNPNGQFPFFTCSRSHTFSDSYSFDTEAILIAGNGEVGNLHYINGKFEAYQRTYVLCAFSAHVRYLWQQLSAYLADSLGLGKIGSSIPYIKKENLIGFEFGSPRDPTEQTAIAEVLTDMDAELAGLTLRREKTRDLKQAMMQELLTGKTRLV